MSGCVFSNNSRSVDCQVKLTVCIPVRNMVDTIERAVLSAVKAVANYPAEILIIDNASTDGTDRIIEKYEDKEQHRVRAIYNKRNIGFCGNFISCINNSRGELITFIGGDDILLSEVIQVAENIMSNDSVVMGDASIRVFYGDESAARIVDFGKENMIYKNNGRGEIETWWANSAFDALPGWIVKRSNAIKYIDKIPRESIIPQVHLAFMLMHDGYAIHQPVVIAHQRISDDPSQLANLLYRSASTIEERIDLIKTIERPHCRFLLRDLLERSIALYPGYKSYSGNAMVCKAFWISISSCLGRWSVVYEVLIVAVVLAVPRCVLSRLLKWFRAYRK